ncbi:hypothetical protein Tco_1154254 [Tanacetum coccineum]
MKLIVMDEHEFQDVKEYSLRLFAKEDAEKSKNTATCISTASRNSTKESFVTKFPLRNIVDCWMSHRSRLQIRVQDETGIMSLTLWNDEVQAIFPTEITAFIVKKYAFKVSIDEYNVKKLLPVFTVLRLSGDPEILDSIRMDTEATSSTLPTITLLDLESQTNKNTTPVNAKKINAMNDVDKEESSNGKNKRPAENDISNESSNGKKMAIEVKTEKDA